MIVVIEVVVTNMETGHVAINQQKVELYPAVHTIEQLKRELKLAGEAPAEKVGPILISRSYTIFEN